ncbi:hypothetical protein [Aquimarina algiphila]|uniref:Uncharacterized protein n=1 Tax=Aquimarina algiphila TaxID=2047982 RepID=A0A554VE13_9FLAO|nr:hypothetical protein [Aquimarina algiphila]TSE05148.1 hypothetical protein FOF46_23930 [Aquimarina algiphila]
MENNIEKAHKAILNDIDIKQLLDRKAAIFERHSKPKVIIEEGKETSFVIKFSDSVQNELDFIDQMITERANKIKEYYNVIGRL